MPGRRAASGRAPVQAGLTRSRGSGSWSRTRLHSLIFLQEGARPASAASSAALLPGNVWVQTTEDEVKEVEGEVRMPVTSTVVKQFIAQLKLQPYFCAGNSIAFSQ